MKTVLPKHTRGEVNRAGEILRERASQPNKLKWATDVLGNWRAIHNYPVNTFQATLRKRLEKINPNALVAQRLKRFPSIVDKLRRFPTMQLARMQDIGGIRVVVESLAQVYALRNSYMKGRLRHQLFSEHNYIDQPKESGYRGIHLVFRYKNVHAPDYDGLFVEFQLRTRQQHAWATAVETAGLFLRSALKSSEGPQDWLDFFALTGSAFAHLEGRPAVPGFEHLTSRRTYRDVAKRAERLRVRETLTEFGKAINAIRGDVKKGTYYLLLLDPTAKTIQRKAYGKDQFDSAAADYLTAEDQIAEGSAQQAVLVAAASVEAMARAYPNFFLNTQEFLRILDHVVEYETNPPVFKDDESSKQIRQSKNDD